MPIEEPYNIIQSVKEGETKASKAYVKLRALKNEIEYSIKEIESELLDEITQLDAKEDLIVDGYKISHVAGRVTYNFKDSEVWLKQKESLKLVEEKLKQATKLGVDLVEPETGEVYEPITKRQGSGYIKMEQSRTPLIDIIK